MGGAQNGSGRKRGPEYDHFIHTETTNNGKTKKFKCAYCCKGMSQDIHRMKKHLAECPSATKEIRVLFKAKMQSKVAEDAERSILAGTSLRGNSSNGSTLNSYQSSTSSNVGSNSTMLSYFTRPPSKTKTIKFYDKLTLSLITSNIPWAYLDNPYFCEALLILRPGTQPLTAAKTRSEVLHQLDAINTMDCTNFVGNSMYFNLF